MILSRRSFAGGLAFGALALGGLVLGGRPRPGFSATATVRIGVQKYGTLIILRERRVLEAALKPLGVEVSWHEFPGGPQLLEALSAGAIDFGATGEAPPIFAQAAGSPLVYVGVEPPSPKGEAILVLKDSPIHTLLDLRGKKIALNKGSNVHYFLVRALASIGLKPADIVPVYLAPADARAAFGRGSVDAWVIWDPFLAAAQDATGARVLTDATGLAPNRQFFVSTRAFATAQPALLVQLNAQIDATDRWAESNQAETVRLLAASMGLAEPVVAQAVARMGYGVQPLTPEIIADQQKIADTFFDLGLIPKKLDVANAVWRPEP